MWFDLGKAVDIHALAAMRVRDIPLVYPVFAKAYERRDENAIRIMRDVDRCRSYLATEQWEKGLIDEDGYDNPINDLAFQIREEWNKPACLVGKSLPKGDVSEDRNIGFDGKFIRDK